MTDATHSELSFALDVADKVIKAVAVLLGGIWTYWNCKKSRTYEKKLDLQLTATVFEQGDLYVDIIMTIANIGQSRHVFEPDATFCTIFAVLSDLSEVPLHIFPAFTRNRQLEPGEATNDAIVWRIQTYAADVVWLRLDLRTASRDVEWSSVSVVRVRAEPRHSGSGGEE